MVREQDIVLFVYDCGQVITKDVVAFLSELTNVIVVCAKSDLLDQIGSAEAIQKAVQLCEAKGFPHIFCSAKTGEFLNDLLRAMIIEKITAGKFEDIEGGVYKM